jgi:hypothetical protein
MMALGLSESSVNCYKITLLYVSEDDILYDVNNDYGINNFNKMEFYKTPRKYLGRTTEIDFLTTDVIKLQNINL